MCVWRVCVFYTKEISHSVCVLTLLKSLRYCLMCVFVLIINDDDDVFTLI